MVFPMSFCLCVFVRREWLLAAVVELAGTEGFEARAGTPAKRMSQWHCDENVTL